MIRAITHYLIYQIKQGHTRIYNNLFSISIDRCLMIWVRFYMKHSFNRKYKYPRRRGWRWFYQFEHYKLYSVVIEKIFCVHLSLIFFCLSLFGCMYEYGPKYIVVFITLLHQTPKIVPLEWCRMSMRTMRN